MKHSDFLKYQEKKEHGSAGLPFVIYGTFIPELIKTFQAHWHDEMEIIYCFKGRCSYHINFKEYIISEGDILVVPPTVIHSFKQYEDEMFEGISILFKLDMINNTVDVCSDKYFMPIFSNEIILQTLITNNDKYSKEAQEIIKSILNSYFYKKNFYELELKMHLFSLFSFYLKNNLYVKKTEKTFFSKTTDKTKKILKYVEEHYSEKITLEMLANETNQSVYNLAHSFKKYTGQSLLDFINGYRLSIAAKMLTETKNPIINIALETGFNNVSYFNRAFKVKYHMTPTEYRKKEIKSEKE